MLARILKGKARHPLYPYPTTHILNKNAKSFKTHLSPDDRDDIPSRTDELWLRLRNATATQSYKPVEQHLNRSFTPSLPVTSGNV